ncbi:hypothetical protein KAK06_04030 [Ideonella sp. 4Y11]|uniref:Lipoprotein n=1 Tax=Ideonella aquatica TaxID=2824119 RepID=A0A940YF20_9BURK|nr:hypothetical protein [Ideonella aquatica]MBQ0958119.1 hypothetical protein [Ideonella aquatica]
MIRAALAALLTSLLVAACGGGGPAAETPLPEAPQMQGVATDALAPEQRSIDITVKGRSGLARTASSILSGTAYEVTLDQLEGPYLLASARSEGRFVHALVTQPGVANLTPLSTLVVAQLLQADPDTFFENLGAQGGVPAVTDAQIQAAQEQVAYHLWRRLGLDWRGSASFTTTAFTPQAGDPMFDRLRSLQSALAAQGRDMAGLVTELLAQAGRCQGLRVAVLRDAQRRDLCPQARSTGNDPLDLDTVIHRFEDVFGDTLTLRVRTGVLSSVVLEHEGLSWRCDGTGCAGIRIGAPDERGERLIDLTDLSLQAADGRSARLSGQLLAAAGGRSFPPLECSDNRVWLIPDSGAISGYCGDAPAAFTSGRLRQIYLLTDLQGADPRRVELTVADRSVVSVSVWQREGETDRVSHRCLGAACSGVSVSAADADDWRQVVLDDTPLPAVDATGAPSGGEGLRLRATMTVQDERQNFATTCGFGEGGVLAKPSDEGLLIEVCKASQAAMDEWGVYDLVTHRLLGPGHEVYSIGTALVRREGADWSAADNLQLETRSGVVSRVVFRRRDGQRFSCEGAAACAGVSVSAPDGDGVVTLSYVELVLTERTRGQLPGDRTLRLNGSYTMPPL